MSEPKLLPCPFCSGDAKLVEVDSYKPTFCIECTQCPANVGKEMGTISGLDHAYFDLSDEAVAAWNRRAKPEHVAGGQ